MEVNEILCRVRSIMKDRKITQKDLAARMGVSQNQVSQYLAGIPRLDTFLKIAAALGLEAAELLKDEAPTTTTTANCPQCGRKLTITVK